MFKKIFIAKRGSTIRQLMLLIATAQLTVSPTAMACAWSERPPEGKELKAKDVIAVSATATLDPKTGRGVLGTYRVIQGGKLASNSVEFTSFDPDFDSMQCGPWLWTTNKTRLTGTFYLKRVKGSTRYLIYQFKG